MSWLLITVELLPLLETGTFFSGTFFSGTFFSGTFCSGTFCLIKSTLSFISEIPVPKLSFLSIRILDESLISIS